MKDLFWAFSHFSEHIYAGLTLIMLILGYILIFILQILRKKNIILITLIMGLLIGFYYLLVTSLMVSDDLGGVDQTQKFIDSIYLWLTMAWTIFMMLILVALPIYVFTMVSTAFTHTRHVKKDKKLIAISFLSLLSMTLLGIFVALCFFPFIWLLQDQMQISVISGEESTSIFGGIWPNLENVINQFLKNYGFIVIGFISLAIIFALIMNILHLYIHDWGEKLISFVENIKKVIKFYLSGIAKMVPYVFMGMLIVLFTNYENMFLSTLGSLILFILFFFLGLAIVWGIEFSFVVNWRKTKDTINKKEFNKLTKEYAINDFAIQSAPILYPITVSYVKKLGVRKDVLETTPRLTTFMGYSMCGGFYPTLIVIFTLIQPNAILINNDAASIEQMLFTLLATVPLIMFMTLGMTGVPGADVAIIIALLSALGLNPGYFFTIYLIEPMLDKFRGVGNSMGFAAASLITDRIYQKSMDKKELKIKNDEIKKENSKI
ncbi:MAG: hypothetical protein TYPL_2340 [Candidatus Tyloplasma litorale]|nr:MAG: hypothetical protein TYPL_2340 [Mycoplasmatales bacterium]